MDNLLSPLPELCGMVGYTPDIRLLARGGGNLFLTGGTSQLRGHRRRKLAGRAGLLVPFGREPGRVLGYAVSGTDLLYLPNRTPRCLTGNLRHFLISGPAPVEEAPDLDTALELALTHCQLLEPCFVTAPVRL